MKYTMNNVTLDISVVGRDDMMGDCWFQIPESDREFLEEHCGTSYDEEDDLFEFDDLGGIAYKNQWGWESTNPDILIAYLSYLLQKDGPQTCEVQYEHPFWAIHDMQHALYDESGCTIYVDAGIERERLIKAFHLLKEEGIEPTYEMIEEISEAFRARFGEPSNIYVEDYITFEDDEEE